MPGVIKLKKGDLLLRCTCLTPKPELFAPPHTLSFTSRTCSCSPWEETRGRDLSDFSDRLLAAEWNSWTWSQGGQYLGVKGLHHSGANSRPESSSGALSRLPGLQGYGPRAALGQESSSLSLAGVIRGTSWCGHQAGKCGRKEEGRKTEGWERRRRAPAELEKLDLIWQGTISGLCPVGLRPEIFGEGQLTAS